VAAETGMKGLAFPLHEASKNATQVDVAFFSILAIAGAILLLLTVLVAVFAIRYRRGSAAPRGALPDALRREIEIGWITATTFLAIFIFWWFVGGTVILPRAVAGQLEIHVVAKQWMWKTQHPDGAREIDALHLPINVPVRLIMTSEDVIHSFYVPAFRLKQDVLPVISSELEFTPTRLGTYHLFCAEYCGAQHSRMTGQVVVMTQTDYAQWLRQQPHGDSLIRDGENLYDKFGCGACHAPGSHVQAPKLGGVAGQPVRLEGGAMAVADDAYLRRAIISPRADIVAGFAPIMPSYASVATASEVDALVAYIQTIPKEDTPHG
jgi:cytochrome c oxidase subunit 2